MARSRDLPQSRSVPGLQHGFVQFRRRLEGTPFQGVAAKHITAMKLSTEAFVAAAVAVAFAVLSIGVVAEEQNERGPSSTNTPALSQMAARGFDTSLSGSGDNDVLGLY
jgi:hypothetical protein